MTTILTVFGCMLALCLAPIVAGAIVAYWKQLFIVVGVLLILFTGLIAWSTHESRRANDAYDAAHPEEYQRFHDPTYQERKRLADDITMAIEYWRNQGKQIPYKKGPHDPGDFEIVDGINQMTQTRSGLETVCEVLYGKTRSLDQLRTIKAVLPARDYEADYSVRAPVPVSTPSPSPQPKSHTTSPETYVVEK